MKLKDKVVVVIGSTRGIGRAIARACSQQGAKVVISFRKESVVKESFETFQKEGFKISGIKVDVAVTADLIKLFNHSVKRTGDGYPFLFTILKPFICKGFRASSGIP